MRVVPILPPRPLQLIPDYGFYSSMNFIFYHLHLELCTVFSTPVNSELDLDLLFILDQ